MNQFPPPKAGLQFDLEGPHASRLIDNVDIYDQVTYKDVHVLPEEWDIVTQSEAEPYLPKRTTPISVTIGIEDKVTLDMPTFGQASLADHFKYKRGYVLNTGINIWGLDFVPKLAQNETDRSIQYLAVSGYRGSSEEHIGMNEIQPTGTYLNSIQIWKLKLSVKQNQEEAVLELCLLHDFGVIFDLQWCPYGAYEEEIPDRLPKLGILSFVAGDGTTRTVVVPHPDAVRRQISPNGDPKQPVYSK
ncbi:hypothetical protein BD770DRAFT_318557 [Pilaira anomala]|nr:hypothetical protein BD770DRAFT_318557 [Pilaira anomala]